MLSHTHIGISDLDRAFEFYSVVMEELGYPLKFREDAKSWAGWMPPGGGRPLFLIGHPFDGGPADPGNGQMVALMAPTREAVDRCYEKALAAGASDDGPPGLRPQYHEHYYGAYVRDPDGNKLCICCHEAG